MLDQSWHYKKFLTSNDVHESRRKNNILMKKSCNGFVMAPRNKFNYPFTLSVYFHSLFIVSVIEKEEN
jgi:hypothetical protein